jgi:hypothetical protein
LLGAVGDKIYFVTMPWSLMETSIAALAGAAMVGKRYTICNGCRRQGGPKARRACGPRVAGSTLRFRKQTAGCAASPGERPAIIEKSHG